MAEIKIEKKKPVWPWILLAVVVVGLIIWWVAADDDVDRIMTDDTTQVQDGDRNSMSGERPDEVNTYVMIFDERNMGEMSLDHDFTNNALTKLIDAVRAQADQDEYNIKADLDQAREYADQVTRDPYETTHADNIRKAAESIARALQNMQQANYPNLKNEAQQVQDAAMAIRPGVLTLDQKNEVKTFFRKSADLLDKMND
ncbi:MAG: hypothetical protein EOM83_13435 [Clostridia bacterium]|nr:hypothetical protein [Clostridia bacterium]